MPLFTKRTKTLAQNSGPNSNQNIPRRVLGNAGNATQIATVAPWMLQHPRTSVHPLNARISNAPGRWTEDDMWNAGVVFQKYMKRGKVLPGIPTLVSLTQALWKTHQKLGTKKDTLESSGLYLKRQHLKKKKQTSSKKRPFCPLALSDWKCLLSQPFAVNLTLGWCIWIWRTSRFGEQKPGQAPSVLALVG